MLQLLRALVDLPVGWSILVKASALLAFGWIMHAALLRANPRWRVLLWRGVLVGLAALPILSAVVALPVTFREPLPSPAVSMEYSRMEAPRVAMVAAEPAPVDVVEEPSEPPIATEPPEPAFSPKDWLAENWTTAAIAIWALGVAFLSLRFIAVYIRMSRVFSAAGPASVVHEELLRRIASDLEFHRPVRLRVTGALSSPLVAGLRRPVIYLPERYSASTDQHELAAILAHEVAHLRARDLYWLMAARLWSIVLWPHPLAWRTLSAHASACEEVSDAVAAGYLKDAAAYVRTLARVALAMAGRPAEESGIPMARSSRVAWRLESLKRKVYASPLARRRMWMSIVSGLIFIVGFSGLRIVQAQEALPPAKTINPADVPPGARILHFPADRSLGRISINKRHYDNPYYMYKGDWGYWDEYEWEFLADARGDVVIPPGKLARLDIAPPIVFQDLSALERLGPNDIHHLAIAHDNGDPNIKTPAGFNPDNIMPHLAGLTGLKVLNLRYTSVTAKGLAVLPRFTSLERLITPLFHTTSNGLAIIGRMKTLKGLYDISSPQKSRVKIDCTPLSRLTNLEEVSITGVAAEGMRELESLPNLKWLQTSGEFNDAVMTSISRIPNLRLLDIGGSPYVNLKILAQSPSIEDLDLHWNTRVTDNDVASLRGMRNLKSIDLWHAPLTDRGAEYLSGINTLESVELSQLAPFTDQALIALSRLPRLKQISGLPMTARGLAALAARAETMETLNAYKPDLNDAALAEIGKLTHLKRLTLQLGSATNAGLAHLKALTQLEACEIFSKSDRVSIAGISQLGSLGNMRRFLVHYITQDNSVLDISGMKNLEVLHFYLKPYQSLHDSDLACLANMKKMEWLQLGGGDELTDHGLSYLAGLDLLNTRLMVGSKNFTDDGIKSLAAMQKLRELVITGAIGDAGLAEIAKLNGLTRLEVNTSAQVSPEGMEAVRRIPMLKVANLELPDSNKMPVVGQDSRDIKIQTLDGIYTPLSKLAENKILMLHLWATYDQNSIAEIPRLRKVNQLMNQKFPGRFALVSVSINEEDGLWREFIAREKMDWMQGRSRGALYAFGLKTLPAYFLLTPDGKVLLNPESSWKNIDAVIARELGK